MCCMPELIRRRPPPDTSRTVRLSSCDRHDDHATPERPRTPPGPGGSTSSPATSGSRTCGRCRRRAARTTSLGWCRGWPRATRRKARSRAVRALFAIRWKVGELLGWDGPDTGIGSRVPTLRDRLPVDLRDAPSGPDFDALPFTSLYLLDDEWAAEIANRTMHGVHAHRLGPGRDRRLPRPDGRLGEAKRPVRDRLHGRDQAVPAPDRVPGDDARDRAGLAGARRRADAPAPAEPRA